MAIEQPFDVLLDNRPTAEKRLIETMPGGVALADFDGDGLPDVAFANAAAGLALFKNEGAFRFTMLTAPPAPAYMMGLAAGDYNGDGRIDLFAAGVEKDFLFRNDGAFRFTDVTAASGLPATKPWSVGGGWLDYDRDGHLDLFVVRYAALPPGGERFCGDPARKLRQYCHPRFYLPLPNALFRNRGDGTFEDVSIKTGIAASHGKGMSVGFLDGDQDGWTDIFVSNDTEPSFLFRNVEGKSFEETALLAGVAMPDAGRPVSAMGVATADFNNDGRDDLAYTALMGETFPIFFGTGRNLFADKTYPAKLGALTRTKSGWSILAVDLDNDGRTDLFTANGDVQDNAEAFGKGASKQANLILRNTGGAFEAAESGEPAFHRGAASGDLNGDGALDIVVSRLNARPILIRGSAPEANGWVRVRAPLGSRILVEGRNGFQRSARVESACGYISSCEPVAHIGTGTVAGPFRVTVTPPKQPARTFPAQSKTLVTYSE